MPEQAAARGTLLAFDFGLRRIGVAVGQTATRTASPLTTISAITGPDWGRISKLFAEWHPSAVVVGLPLDAEGLETEMSGAARRFGGELERRHAVPVFFMDERLTSRQAQEQFALMRASGSARRRDAGRLDAIAAKIILENWLQSLPDAGEDRPGPD